MKAKVQIKSIFEQIAEKVFTMNNLNEIKSFVTEFVEGKNINSIDKNTILMNVDKCKNVQAVQRYICNSLLQYEGMSVR
jgi:phage FluMu gp28-like protein